MKRFPLRDDLLILKVVQGDRIGLIFDNGIPVSGTDNSLVVRMK
jgi:hypothetical protein